MITAGLSVEESRHRPAEPSLALLVLEIAVSLDLYLKVEGVFVAETPVDESRLPAMKIACEAVLLRVHAPLI